MAAQKFLGKARAGFAQDLRKVDLSLDEILPARSPGKIRGRGLFGTFLRKCARFSDLGSQIWNSGISGI